MERVMKFHGKYYYYAESGTKQRINFLAEGFSSKGVATLVVQGDGEHHLYINDSPRFWTGINGAPAGKVNPWFMYIPPGTHAKPDISKWKAEIHYVDSKGRVTKSRDFGAVAYHVSPSGRTTKSVRHSDRKPGRAMRKVYSCPVCGSTDTELSWGAEGYLQCNYCGMEFLQPGGIQG